MCVCVWIQNRKHCILPSEVLLSVTTQPFDMTISSSIDETTAPAAAAAAVPINQVCFLCNTTECDTFVNLYDTSTSHSNTPVFDFVWKFLDDKPSVRDDTVDAANSNWNALCIGCFQKINEYDLACETATRLEEELRWELSQTEATYAAQQNTAHSSNPAAPTHIEVIEEIHIVNEPINLDSPPPADELANDDPIDDTTIELSDDDDGATQAADENQTIELSDDDL